MLSFFGQPFNDPDLFDQLRAIGNLGAHMRDLTYTRWLFVALEQVSLDQIVGGIIVCLPVIVVGQILPDQVNCIRAR